MQVISDITARGLEPCVATIGFFDGVHAGHRFLIEQVKREASASRLRSAVVTFGVHPRHVVHPDFTPELLTTTDEKLALLGQTGVDYCILLNFDAHMAALSARDFMDQVLRQQCNVSCLLVGHDHRFGHNRAAGLDDYRQYGAELGMEVKRALALKFENLSVSSSHVRSLLAAGDVATAGRCLTYPYSFCGTVVSGHRVGRELGFPTANIRPTSAEKLIPADGVYAVRVSLADGTEHAGMLNIGHRPTIGNGTERTIEVHILHFSADIYGTPIRISFISRLRGETKFAGRAELIAQLRADEQRVEQIVR